jgi:hypothetical protein
MVKTNKLIKNPDNWTELQMNEKSFIHAENKNISYNLCRKYLKLLHYVPKCILINK